MATAIVELLARCLNIRTALLKGIPLAARQAVAAAEPGPHAAAAESETLPGEVRR